jgi:hypothetical protein
MSETENTEQMTALEAAEQVATKLNEENAQLRAELEQARSVERITPEEQRRRHGDELYGILTGPNTGGGTLR